MQLSDEDVAAALAATPGPYRSLVITLVGLGLRISEACGLRVVDVDFLRKVVHLRQQRRPGGSMGQLKTVATARDIPVDDAGLGGLAEQIRRRPRSDGMIFSGGSGSSLIAGGVSIVAASRWLGHSSPEITWRVYSYLMASDEDAGRAAIAATLGRVVPDVYPFCTRPIVR